MLLSVFLTAVTAASRPATDAAVVAPEAVMTGASATRLSAEASAASASWGTTAALAARVRGTASCSVAHEDAGRDRNTVLDVVPEVEHTGPIYLNSDQRPVKVVLASTDKPGQKPIVFLPIWKCATSLVEKLLRTHYMTVHGPHDEIAPAVGTVTLANRSHVHAKGPISASEEYDAATQAGAVGFSVVREPFQRFVSAWEPIRPLSQCLADGATECASGAAGCSHACTSVLADMEALAQTLADGRLFERGGFEHL
eukprot:5770024-Prymnesium_polylepis.1